MRSHFLIHQPLPGRRTPVWSPSLQKFFSTGASPVQASRDVAASLIATQPVEADGAKVATQPVEAPGARSVVHYQPIGTGSEDVRLVDPSLTSKKTVPVGLLVCRLTLTQKMTYSDPGSPAGTSEEQVSCHTGTPLEIKTWTKSCLKKPTTSKPWEGWGCLWGGTRYQILTLPHHLGMTTPLPVPGPANW